MKRLLFVDDEPNILQGLERMLRTQRHVWEMVFVGSGPAALEEMAALHFDVIVADMRMPGMDGATLLKEVQERWPGTVRIVLSGHSDLEASLRSISVSHQFLTKPCDADVLRDVVARACNLEVLLNDASLQEVVGRVGELPVLPRTYQALTAALGEPEADLVRVGGIVEGDPAIAAKILQIVNSSFFGVRREITSVRQATTYLGANTLRDLVLAFAVFGQLDGAQTIPGFSVEREQAHALLVARVARKLAEDRRTAEQAFLAAVLHDLGRLVLATRLPAALRRSLDAGAGRERPFHVVEEETLGVTHSEVGAYLLGLWGMPYPVVEAVAFHHHPSRIGEATSLGVLGAVHIADALTRELDGTVASAVPLLDTGHLGALDVPKRLPEWREIALRETGRDEAA